MDLKLLKNIFQNNLSQGLQFGSRWFLNLVLIKSLSIDVYADFSYFYSISNILVSFIPFGSSAYLLSLKNDQNSLYSNFKESCFVSVISLVIALMCLGVSSFFIDSLANYKLLFLSLVLSFAISINLNLFSFYKASGNFNKDLIAYSIFGLIVLFISYLISNSFILEINTVFTALILVNLLVFLIFYPYSIKSRNASDKSIFLKIKSAYINRKHFGYQEVLTGIYTQIGVIVLYHFLDSSDYGSYRSLFLIISPIYLITTSLFQVYINFLKNLKHNITNHFRKLQLLNLGLSMVVIICLFLLKDLILVELKLDTIDNVETLYYILIFTVFIRFSFPLYEVFLVVKGMQKLRMKSSIFTSIFNMCLIIMVIPFYGLTGAMYVQLFTNAFVLIFLLYFSELKLIRKIF